MLNEIWVFTQTTNLIGLSEETVQWQNLIIFDTKLFIKSTHWLIVTSVIYTGCENQHNLYEWNTISKILYYSSIFDS
jgi:hypothetical protein